MFTKNNYGDPDFTNNSLAHPEEMLDNETLQATTGSGHNVRGQANVQTELTFAVSQAEHILHMCEIGYKIHISEFVIQVWRNNSYIAQH